MVLRTGGIARRAVRGRRCRKNPLENFDEFQDADLEASFFREFPRDALFERFSHFQQAAGDGPLTFERHAAAANEQRASLVDHHTADADHRLIGVFSSRCHGRFWLFPSRAASRYIILQQPSTCVLAPKEVIAVVRCPECATEIDVDEDEVEEGEILACPECETEMEVVQIHPVKVNAISDDDDEEEEEESEDGDDFPDDDEEEEEEEV